MSRKKNGYTIIEVIISFSLIMIVMIYLLRTIIVISTKNNEVVTEENYRVFESGLLNKVYEDIDTLRTSDVSITSGENSILFDNIGTTLNIDRENNQVIYNDIIYSLPEGYQFRDTPYGKTCEENPHKYCVVTLNLKNIENNTERNIKIVYQKADDEIYDVTLVKNNGEEDEYRRVLEGNNLGNLPTPSKEGYTFDGWYTAATGGIKVSESEIPNDDKIYYAHWIANTFTVAYNANGGSGTTSSHDCTYGSTCTLKSNSFSRTGHTFNGWKKENSGTTLSAGASIANATSTNGATVTYYAQWTVNSYTASFNANGGSSVSTTITKNYGTALGTLPTTSRTGYTFAGWYTAKTGSSKISTSTTMPASNPTYYAHWIPIKYDVTFDANGGTNGGTLTQYSYTYNLDYNGNRIYSNATYDNSLSTTDTVTIEGANSLEVEITYQTESCCDYVYVRDSEGTNISSKLGGTTQTTQTVSVTGSTTKLYFHSDGSVVNYGYYAIITGTTNASITTLQRAYNQTIETLPTPTRTGYTFAGWYTSSSGGSQITSSTTITANKIYYAHWTPITYTVAYNGNEATSGSTAQSTHTYDVAKKLTTNGFQREGYTFAGWNTASNGSGTSYTDGQSVSNLTTTNGQTINLYAQWTPITYTVAYNGNGATSGSTAESTHTYDVAKKLTTNGFQREGYTFAGWNTASNGSGTSYTDGQSVSNLTTTDGQTINLYAQWVGNTFTVNYDKNDTNATGTTASHNCIYGSTCYLSSNGFSNTGKNFTGWKKSNTGALLQPGASIANIVTSGTVTYYAQWEKIVYTATFNANSGTLTAVSHTPNISDDGVQNSNYTDNVSYTEVITIPNASSLTVEIYYNGESTSYDWASVWSGSHPEYTAYDNYSSSTSGKLGGSQSNSYTVNGNTITNVGKSSYTISGDTVTIGFRSDGSQCGNGYGYYAVIKPTNSTSKITKASGETINSLPVATRSGYDFIGWYTSASGGTKITNTTTMPSNNTTTYYAHWIKAKTKITFNANGGEITAVSHTPNISADGTQDGNYANNLATIETISIPNASSLNVTLTYATEASWDYVYVFTGEYSGDVTKNMSAGQTYTYNGSSSSVATTTFTIEGDTVSFAFYSDSSNNYYGYYAVVTPTSTTTTTLSKVSGEIINSLPMATKEGFEFDGWYTSATGGSKITADSTVPSSNVTYYAHYVAIKPIITFNGNGGELTAVSHTANISDDGVQSGNYANNLATTETISIPNASSLNVTLTYGTESSYDYVYVFTGEYKGSVTKNMSAGQTYTYNGSSASPTTTSFTIAGDTVSFSFYSDSSNNYYGYYAQVTPTSAVTTLAKEEGNKITSMPMGTKDDYELEGWYTLPSGGTKVINTDSMPSTDTTLYAHWAPKPVITFNANGGDIAKISKTTNVDEYGNQVSNYDNNWTNANIDGTDRGDTSLAHVVTIDGASNLRLLVTYGGESSNYDWVSIWSGSHPSYTASSNYSSADVAQKLGGGDHTSESNTVELVTSGDTVTLAYKSDGSQVGDGYGYYAKVVGIDVPTTEIIRSTGEELGFLPSAYKKGYEFIGWYTAATGGTQISSSTSTPAGGTTYYAHYEKIISTVTFNANGGTLVATSHTPNVDNTGLKMSDYTDYLVTNEVISIPSASSITIDSYYNGENTSFDWLTIWAGDYPEYLAETNYSSAASSVQKLGGAQYGSYTVNGNSLTSMGYNNYSISGKTATFGFKSDRSNAGKGYGYYSMIKPSSGTASISTLKKMAGEDINSLPIATRSGYNFAGWYTTSASSGGTEISSGSPMPKTNTTYYARWTTTPTYTVTFNANGGTTPSPSTITRQQGQALGTLPTTSWTDGCGHEFIEWNTASDGSGTTITSSTIIPNNNTTVYYAQWTQIPSYKVTFDANGGTTPSPSSIIERCKNQTLGTLPTTSKTGYRFEGWLDSSNNSIDSQTVIPSNNTTTYYAAWNKNEYQVQYVRNCPSGVTGSGTMSNSQHLFDVEKSLTANAYTCKGKKFIGWNTKSDGTGDSYVDQETVVNLTSTDNGIVSLYGQWIDDPLNVYLDTQDTSADMSFVSGWPRSLNDNNASGITFAYNSKSIVYNSTYGELPVAIKTGYSFDGWYTGINVPNITLDAGTKDNKYAVLTYNIKPDVTYTITIGSATKVSGSATQFNVRIYDFTTSKTLSGTSVNTSFGSNKTITVKCPSSANKNNNIRLLIYAGLQGSTAGNKVTYSNIVVSSTGVATASYQKTATSTVNIAYDHHLFAHYTPYTYTISYNKNNGTGSMSNTTCTYDQDCTLRANSFTRSGYSFDGWNTKSGGTGDSYSNKEEVKNLTSTSGGTVTLYAQWTTNQYTVKFDPNGGSVSTTSKKVSYNSTYGTLPTPTRSGYIFLGWFTSKSYTFDSAYYYNHFDDAKTWASNNSSNYQAILDHYVRYGISANRKSSDYQVVSTDTYTQTSSQTLYAQWIRKGRDSTCGCQTYKSCTHSNCGTSSERVYRIYWVLQAYCTSGPYNADGYTWYATNPGTQVSANCNYAYGTNTNQGCCTFYRDITTTNTCRTSECGCETYNECYY